MMESHSQPETHAVLLAISAAAFIVLMVLGFQLHNTVEHQPTSSDHRSSQPAGTGH